MDVPGFSASEVSAAVTELEDTYVFDTVTMRAHAAELERRAYELDEPLLAARARLCLGHLCLRAGEVADADRIIRQVNRWATEHGDRQLLARSHSLWASVHRHSGDDAAALDHMVIAVELLDAHCSPYLQIWARVKLADALGQLGSMDAARERYADAEQLAERLGQERVHVGVLNNWAWTECDTGNPGEAGAVVARMLDCATRYGFALEPADMDTVAAVQIANGAYAQAEELLLICIERHRRDDDYEEADALPEYLLSLARARRGRGTLDPAQHALDECRDLCAARGLNALLARVHAEQAEIHAARGEFAEAFMEHRAYVAAVMNAHSEQREASARTRLALLETAEARREAADFRAQARHDALTGVYNRRFVDEVLPVLAADGTLCAVALLDIDHFKRLNDELSHATGDRVLVTVAEILHAAVSRLGPDAFVARIGGEEFLIALPRRSAAEAATIADTVRGAVRAHPWVDLTRGLPVTVSIGVAGTDEGGDAPSALLSRADARLYEAKRGGRDRVAS
ncbi:GGDEF domain-containing protein [Actinoplanes sp. NEAU-A12]|uniref:GGDEF domain-containing protein n=1 Tax=Actinoplanes sandaracinus TaxID=3045177 RepID=A0ABT6WNT9_9ACTN|nr:GGDEF domain-containing protein [Actinoplanes sandaracinus]MDI6101400.1 GGDEF domain-containing protein [Actinoplanes sandaracinus]